jgi:hypothetical protein
MGNALLTGKIEFIQYHKPGLESGDYEITVTQQVAGAKIRGSQNQFEETKRFSVAGPRFDLPPQDIYAMFPPPGNHGEHANVLPHIILNRSTLPWEREACENADGQEHNYTPWLALLVFHQDEIEQGRVSEPKIVQLDQLKKENQDNWWFPDFEREAFQRGDDKTTVIDVQKDLLDAIMPTLEDLRYLAHVRQRKTLSVDIDSVYRDILENTWEEGSTQSEAIFNNQRKTFSEFKEAVKQGGIRLLGSCTIKCRMNGGKKEWVITDTSNQKQYIAREDKDIQQKAVLNVFTNDAEVAVVIANRLPQPNGLTTVHLVSLEKRFQGDKTNYPVSLKKKNLIRLVSLKYWSFSCTDPNRKFKEILLHLNNNTLRAPLKKEHSDLEKYFNKGYVALNHYLRKGDKVLSWYHSPLLPYKNTERLYSLSKQPGSPQTQGWYFETTEQITHYYWGDTGKNTVYSITPCFGINPRVSDQLLRIDQSSGMFDTTYAAAWQLGRMLALQDQRFSVALTNWKQEQAQQEHKRHQACQDLHLYQAASPDQVASLEAPPLEVSTWFDKLNQLQGLPFNYLVPDADMLPDESIRFFQVDPLWVDCLLDGAFSLGRITEAEQKQDFQRIIAGNRYPVMSGVLLRSEAVSGWPGLLVDGYYQLPKNIELTTDMLDNYLTPQDMPELQTCFNAIGLTLASEFRVQYAADTETWTITDLDTNADYTETIVGSSNHPQLCMVMPDRDRHYNYTVVKEVVEEKETRYLKLPLLRIERLANDVLICLFQGDIQRVDIHLKPETLHFGFEKDDDEFSKDLKNPVSGEELEKYNKDSKDGSLVKEYLNGLASGIIKDSKDGSLVKEYLNGLASGIISVEELATAIRSDILGPNKPGKSQEETHRFQTALTPMTSAQFALQMIEGTPLVRFNTNPDTESS